MARTARLDPAISAGPVDFGYLPHDSLIPRPPYHQPLPSTPPPAGDPNTDLCGCPACLSGQYYAISPACRFWRIDCAVCGGRRSYTYRAPRSLRRDTADCFACAEQWQHAVAWFYYVLRSPRAARRLALVTADPAPDFGTGAGD
jgi:hypothetical protein